MKRLVVLFALMAVAATAGAEDVKPLERPLSPGAVALLLAGSVGPDELARWAEALADIRPEVRAAAARGAFTSGAPALVPDLLKAVEKETDQAAAREELIALGALAPGQADEALMTAARRFKGVLDEELARSIGRRGPSALALAPRLRELPLGKSHWKTFFVWSTREGTQELPGAAEAALATGEGKPWGDLLGIALESDQTIEDETLAKAIRSGSSPVRAATYWHLLRQRKRGDKPGAKIRAALDESLEATGEGDDPVAVLAFELLGRALGRSRRDRVALIAGLAHKEVLRLPTDRPVLEELEDAERTAYGKTRFDTPDRIRQILKEGKRQDAARKWAMRDTRVRTASDFPPGLAKDVLALAGCDLKRLQPAPWVGLQVSYDGSGVLENAGVFPMGDLSPGCQTAARVLLLMGFRSFDRAPRPNETDTVALPLAESFFACAAEADTPPPLRLGVDEQGPQAGGITAPERLLYIPPVYPASARDERREGIVILGAVISSSGCVRSVEVLHGPAPDLDGAALRAVTFWRYTPALLRGVPVPTYMTVTVNFRLR